ALGLVILTSSDINLEAGSVEDKIWLQMKTCFDPEIPDNIVDLGLIYAAVATPLGKNEYHVSVSMTLTAAGCGMGPVMVSEVDSKLRQINGVSEGKVESVFD